MKVGYARVSTKDQNLDLQLDALREAGCQKIFREKITGVSKARPALSAALAALSKGDVLVVWKLDRLGRSFQHLVQVVQDLDDRQIGFLSLSDSIDTTSSTGKLLFHIVGAIAEFERALISERTSAGMQAARRNGKRLGRPRKLTAEQIDHVRQLKLTRTQQKSLSDISSDLNVGRTTLWRALSQE